MLLGNGGTGFWAEMAKVVGWACAIWGAALYWWSGLLYLGQGAEVIRRFPREIPAGGESTGSSQ